MIIFSAITAVIALNIFNVNDVEAKSYKISAPKIYKSGGTLKYQKGYFKPSSGKYIQGHFKTGPDNYKWNNRKNLYGF